jgi:hypothetical protein
MKLGKLVTGIVISAITQSASSFTYSTYGDHMYGSDGDSYSTYGNHTYGSDGSSWSTYGDHTYGN